MKYASRKSHFSWLPGTLWCLSAVSAALLLFFLGRLQLLPKRYFLALGALLCLAVALPGLLLLRRKPKKTARTYRTVSGVLSAVLLAVCCTGGLALARLHGTLDSITSTQKQYVLLEVYVRADDAAKTVPDAAGYRFALAEASDWEGSEAVSGLEKLLGGSADVIFFPSPVDMIDALYAGEADAIILNAAYRDVLDALEGYADFSDKTRLLGDYVIEKQIAASPEKPGPLPGTDAPFLLYISGNDARRQYLADGGSDVNILAAVNPAKKQILLVNTPRDYYVVNPASGDGSRDKLSHCGLHGIENCVQAMEGLYGHPMDAYARINFSGFRTLVDALGGVTVHSDKAFIAGGYQIYEGENRLNGDQALAFARERKNLRGGDNDRGKNQMKLIAAMVDQLSAGKLLLHYSDILASLEGMFSTTLPQARISALVQKQIADPTPWEVLSFAVTGDNGNDRCWAVGGGYGYVMYPHENMVSQASNLISRVLEGEALTTDDLIPQQ